MTQPYEHEKLPAHLDPHQAPEMPAPAPLPDPANFAPPTQQPAPQAYGDPRYTHPYPQVPGSQYPQPGYAPQPMYHAVPQALPIVNVTQNNMGGGYVTVRRGPNHGLHLLLTILSCGLWAPVWIVVWVIDAMGRK